MATITSGQVSTYAQAADTSSAAPLVGQNNIAVFPFGSFTEAPTAIGQPFVFTAANWTGTYEVRLLAYFRAVLGTVYVDLYDSTAGAQVAGSLLTTSSTSLTSYVSSALTLVDGHTYFARVSKDTGASGIVQGADIRVRFT